RRRHAAGNRGVDQYHAGSPPRSVTGLYRAQPRADPDGVQCPTCGSLAGRWRSPCGRCGERPSLRAFSRLAFAEDPTAPPLDGAARAAELASPQSRIVAAAIDLALAFIALLWTGAIGADLAFSHNTSAAHQLVRLLTWLAVLAAPILMEASDGQTFGKRIVGIRVVSRETGGPISLFVALHRGGARALF